MSTAINVTFLGAVAGSALVGAHAGMCHLERRTSTLGGAMVACAFVGSCVFLAAGSLVQASKVICA